MFSSLLRGLAPLLLILSAPAAAQSEPPVTRDDLMRHIAVLASDEFRGRHPGTEGEERTTAYIVDQLRARGVQPGGEQGGWFHAVPLVERQAGSHVVSWSVGGAERRFDPSDLLLVGRDSSERLVDAPVVFAGHGARIPERGVDQLAGADLRGAVALILLEGPDVPGFPPLAERVEALRSAGAGAVVTIVGADVAWSEVRLLLGGAMTRRAADPMPAILGTMPIAAAQRLLGRERMEQLLESQPGSSFRAVTLPLRATMDVQTRVHRYVSNNVVGRIAGTAAGGESVLLLAHWDHLGICRAEGEGDRLCNGAVDNASGVASLIEVAGRLANGPRPRRDILLLATTAEEMGLYGAEEFAARPTVPLDSIVAAVNMDTVAIHPAGEPVAVIGRGIEPLDSAIAATVAALGRRMDEDGEADDFVERQDGWALTRAGVPAVMVGGSFSDMAKLGAFLAGTYHSPGDEPGAAIALDGAAEDADLLVALARRLADPALYRRPRS